MIRVRLLAITAALIIGIAACGAPRSGSFSAIDPNDIPDQLTATTTTTTTTTVPSTTTTISTESTVEATSTTIAVPSELVALYFVAGDQVVMNLVPLARPVSIAQVLSVLEIGPSGELSAGLRSAIPEGAQSRASGVTRGQVSVDLDPEFFASMIDLKDQTLAVAQIVLTLTELGGVSAVTFTQNQAPIAVLLSNGQLSEIGQVLYHEDFAALASGSEPVEPTTTSSAPPPTTTSTTTTLATTSTSP